MASDIKIEGLEEVQERLESLVDVNKLAAAVGKACALVERTAKQKAPKDPKKHFTPEELKVRECVTAPRVEKQLFKMIEEGLLDRDYGVEEMGRILKYVSPVVAEDILKEEMEDFPYLTVKDVQAFMCKVLPLVIKDIIKNK